MEFPLDLRFKLMAIASRLMVTDARGNLVYFVKQKAFKLLMVLLERMRG